MYHLTNPLPKNFHEWILFIALIGILFLTLNFWMAASILAVWWFGEVVITSIKEVLIGE